jgi:hypothetical protein
MGINGIKTGWPQHGDPLGWTEDIDGVRIPELAPKPSSKRPKRVQKSIDKAKAEKQSIHGKPVEKKRLKKALTWLRKIGGKR